MLRAHSVIWLKPYPDTNQQTKTGTRRQTKTPALSRGGDGEGLRYGSSGSLGLQGIQALTVVRGSACGLFVRYADQPLFARYAPAFAAAANIASLVHTDGALFRDHLVPAGSSAYIAHHNVAAAQ